MTTLPIIEQWPGPSEGFAWIWDGPQVTVEFSGIAGVDATGPWIEDSLTNPDAGVDKPTPGPWENDQSKSSVVGVDGTGAWIDG
jgi:hypothetical protein